MLLEGKVALVTGAAHGIGKGVALRFAREGAAVVVNGRHAENVEAAVREIERFGGTALAAISDITVEREVAAMFARVLERFGHVDVLVNNALTRLDLGERGPFLKMRAEGWDAFMHANLGALFYCTQHAAKIMARQGIRGSIVNISTVGAARAHRADIAYDAMKGAMDAFTRAVAVDLGAWGIRVNALRPGPILTERDPLFAAPRPQPNGDVPLGRMGYPEDVAWAAVFLAVDDAAFVTGQAFEVDGGLLAQARSPCATPDRVSTPESVGEV